MASTTTARLIATPDSSEQELKIIAEIFDARMHRIKTRHAIVREKIANQLTYARRKNNQLDTLSIRHGLIAMLEAIYDSFNVSETRNQLIKKLNLLLAMLSDHHRHDGFAKSARHAVIYYFHQLLGKKEKRRAGFMSWLECYILQWQQSSVFGEGFDFNEWKVMAASAETRVTQCVTTHHLELLKAVSIALLEDYLTATHVAGDRIKNATILLDNIKALPLAPDSFANFHRMLNISKQLALQTDAQEDATRFSFFRRHRFGSRYITLLDDLRERVLYCQNQQQRKDFQQGELSDYEQLQKQLRSRVDDDHATRYLAKQVSDKKEFIEKAFGESSLQALPRVSV